MSKYRLILELFSTNHYCSGTVTRVSFESSVLSLIRIPVNVKRDFKSFDTLLVKEGS